LNYVNILALVWALVYFVVGLLKGFTVNAIDFWISLVLLFSLFLLPLPITIAAIWFQRVAGSALLLCVAASFIAAMFASASRPSGSLSDRVTFIAFIAMYSIPHVVFATTYILKSRPKIT
jgi:hypothetical protein